MRRLPAPRTLTATSIASPCRDTRVTGSRRNADDERSGVTPASSFTPPL